MSLPASHYLEPVPFPGPANPAPGDECFIDLTPDRPRPGTRMVFCWCPPTSEEGFLVGSPPEERERFDNEKQHRVMLTAGFWLGKHPVTQGQWQALMGGNPSQRGKGATHPVDSVSYEDAEKFAEVSRKFMPPGLELWVPTESQWEWACRVGSASPFGIGTGASLNSQMANFDGNYPYGEDTISFNWLYREKTLAAGCFPPNAWGFHDMHGQLWEWCQDWLGDYPSGPVSNPVGGEKGRLRVLRGGGWFDHGRFARSANRSGFEPVYRNVIIGFRACPSSIQTRSGGPRAEAERRPE